MLLYINTLALITMIKNRIKTLLLFVSLLILCVSFLCVPESFAQEWNFTSSIDGWTARNTDTNLRWSSDSDGGVSGRLYMDTCGSDPGIVSPSNTSFSASTVSKLTINIASYCAVKEVDVWFKNNLSSTLYYAGRIYLANNSNWQPKDFEMGGNSNWTSTIVQLRIDPTENCGGKIGSSCVYAPGISGFVAFDYVRVVASNGSISGGVRDYYTDGALSDVAVRLEQNGVIKKGPVYTAPNGTYTISDVPPGTYRLTGIKSGYQNSFIDGTVINSGQSLTGQNLRMKPNVPTLNDFNINSGASITNNRTVNLNNSASNNPTYYMASMSSNFSGASWYSYSPSPAFTLSSGFGSKRVYLKLKNDTGESNTLYDDINYNPTPVITDNKSSMQVGDAIDLYCDLGSDGPTRNITFFVDRGSGGLITYSGLTNSSGRATKQLTATSDWVPQTYFACRDDLTSEVSGYDAGVTINRPPVVTIFRPHDANGNLVTEISHGWNVTAEIRSNDLDGDSYSCQYQVNSRSWQNTGTINGDFTIPAGEFSPGTTKSGQLNYVRVKCTDTVDGTPYPDQTVRDYPVPDTPPGSLSPNNRVLEPQAQYEFIFSGVDLADHYRWYISEDSQMAGARAEWAGWSPYVDTQLQAGKTYYWKMCAENKLNTQGANGSSCSQIANFTINTATLPPPNIIRPFSGDTLAPLPNGDVGLRWEAVSGASGYRLYIDTLSPMDMPAGQTVYNASGLGIGDHKWKACTVASNQCGALSAEMTFKVQIADYGFVARTVNDPDVYWIMYGKKWKIINPTTLYGLGYIDAEIQWFEAGSLDSLSLGKTILNNNDRLCYRSETDSTVYVIESSQSHPFFQWDNFLGQGFTAEDIYWATPAGVSWIQSIYPKVDAPMIRVEPANLGF